MLSFPQMDVNVGNASLELLGASHGVMGRGRCFRMTAETGLQGPDALHAILRGFSIHNKDRKTKQTPKHKAHWAQSPPPRELTPNVTCFQVACSPAQPLCGGSAVGPCIPCPSPQGRGQPRKPTSVLLSFTSPAGP